MGHLVLSLIFLCVVSAAGQIDPESTTYDMITIDVTTEEPLLTTMVPTPPPPSPPSPSIFPKTTPPTTKAPPAPTTLAPITMTKLPFTTRLLPSATPPTPRDPTMIPTPPPPPPPSPSLFTTLPISTTPIPSQEPMTTRLPPTVATVIHTTQRLMTTRLTTPVVEPTKRVDPVLIEKGGVTVTLVFPPSEFDTEEQNKFKLTIANNVNDFCGTNPENCELAGVIVGPNDVVLYEIRGYDEPETVAILELEGTDTIVSFYVTHPSSSSTLVLNAEQLDELLIENADQIQEELGYGFQRGAADATPQPVTVEPLLDWWIILLICVGGVVILTGLGYMLYRNTRPEKMDKKLLTDSDVEMQEEPNMNGTNGHGPKPVPKVKTEMSTQVSQAEILTETKQVFVNQHGKGTKIEEVDMTTQVSYKEILMATGLMQKDDDNNNASEPDTGVTVAAVVENNQIPPLYEDVNVESSANDLPPPPPELLQGDAQDEPGDKSDNAFDNPAFVAETKIDESSAPRTDLPKLSNGNII